MAEELISFDEIHKRGLGYSLFVGFTAAGATWQNWPGFTEPAIKTENNTEPFKNTEATALTNTKPMVNQQTTTVGSIPNKSPAVTNPEVMIPKQTTTAIPKGVSLTPELLNKAYSQYYSLFKKAAQKEGVDINLLLAITAQESGMNPNAKSGAGAVGMAQFMPKTAQQYGITDRTDPEQSITGCADLITDLLQQYKNRNNPLDLALSGYNAGPRRVEEAGYQVPQIRQTQDYVKKVNAYYQLFKAESARRGMAI